MGLKGFRLWVMGQPESTCRAPSRTYKPSCGNVGGHVGRESVCDAFAHERREEGCAWLCVMPIGQPCVREPMTRDSVASSWVNLIQRADCI
jgi:hypothetical protein